MQDITTVVETLNSRLAKLKELESIEINTKDDLNKYANWLIGIKTQLKQIDKQRHFFTDPLEKQKKQIIALFKPSQELLKKTADIINTKIRTYNKAQTELLLAEQAKNPQAIIEAPERSIKTDKGTVYSKSEWKAEIIDLLAVPKEYWIVDESKIHRAVMNGTRKIEGVRIYQEESIAVRTR